MNHLQKHLSASLIALAALLSAAPMAWAANATAPSLGTASTFTVLSAAPNAGGAVTCTGGSITGDVGSSGLLASVVNNCPISGAIIAPVSAQVVSDFNAALAAGLALPCTDTTLASAYTDTTLVLSPGVYCINAADGLTFTRTTLSLNGPSTASWTFIISGAGGLTGTNFNVVMADGSVVPCDAVTWYVAQAATLTTSNFVGTILAGAAITMTGGTFNGDALAKAAVTMTGTTVTGCTSSHSRSHSKCNQGVGNGSEGCDPGNSNQGNPFNNSNDELGGVPGDPGRQGGNNKTTTNK